MEHTFCDIYGNSATCGIYGNGNGLYYNGRDVDDLLSFKEVILKL